MAAYYPRRRATLVGGGRGGMSSATCRSVAQKLGMDLQRLDVAGSCSGMDQYENYSGFHFLRSRDADWHSPAVVGQRSHGSALETGPRQLSCYPHAAAGVASNETVLSAADNFTRRVAVDTVFSLAGRYG